MREVSPKGETLGKVDERGDPRERVMPGRMEVDRERIIEIEDLTKLELSK